MSDVANRDDDGRFRPGTSGNPGGRPRKLRELTDAIEAAHTPSRVLAILDKLHDLALAGDVAAAKAYLDRTAGPVRHPPTLEDLDFTDAPMEALEWLRRAIRR